MKSQEVEEMESGSWKNRRMSYLKGKWKCTSSDV